MMTGDLLTFRDPGEQDISDIPSGWGAGFGAAFEEGFQSSWGPLAWRFTRRQFMDQADTESPTQMALRTTLQGVAPAFTAAARATVEGDTPMLSEAEANEAFAVGDFKFKGPVSLERAMDLYETNRARLEREDIMRRSSAGTVARFIGGLGGAALDPVNIAAGLLPGALLSRTGMAVGSSFTATTTAQRLGYGALEGAIGSAALAPGTMGMSALEGRPYGVADALVDIAFGTILTAGLHTTIGAFVDWRNTGREMPVVSQAMENATIETRMQVERGAVAAAMEGRPVNVAPVVANEVERLAISRQAEAGVPTRSFADPDTGADVSIPTVLYHGTPDQFEAFNPLSHFGTEQAASERLAAIGSPDGQVRAVAVDMKKPLVVRDLDGWNIEDVAAELERRGVLKPDDAAAVLRTPVDEKIDGKTHTEFMLGKVRAAGYDAFAYRNNAEDAGSYSYVPLDKDAVKAHTPETAAGRVPQSERGPSPVMSLNEARAAVAREQLQPYRDPTDVATSREADEALQGAPSRARTDEQGIGAVTPETRELDAIAAEVDAGIASLKQSGALSAADEASLAAADDLVRKAETETKARDYAAICLSGVDITPKDAA